MNRAHADLLARRAHLVERAEAERHALGAEFAKWENPLRVADVGLSVLRTLRSHRWLQVGAAAGMAALAILRPGSISGWVATAQAIGRLIRGIRSRK